MLSHAVDTHAQLKKPKDREWIHILLSYLKTYVEELGNELLMHEDDKAAYVGRLIDEMRGSLWRYIERRMLPFPQWMQAIQVC